MARRKKTALPRVTVLAYSKRDLVAFADAVEKILVNQRELEMQIDTLQTQIEIMKIEVGRLCQTRRRRAAANGHVAEELPAAAEQG